MDDLTCGTCRSEGVCLPDCPVWRYRFERVLEVARNARRDKVLAYIDGDGRKWAPEDVTVVKESK